MNIKRLITSSFAALIAVANISIAFDGQTISIDDLRILDKGYSLMRKGGSYYVDPLDESAKTDIKTVVENYDKNGNFSYIERKNHGGQEVIVLDTRNNGCIPQVWLSVFQAPSLPDFHLKQTVGNVSSIFADQDLENILASKYSDTRQKTIEKFEKNGIQVVFNDSSDMHDTVGLASPKYSSVKREAVVSNYKASLTYLLQDYVIGHMNNDTVNLMIAVTKRSVTFSFTPPLNR